MNRAAEEQLRDIAKHSPHPGVHAGDLICKTTTRWLIDEGYAKNSGGSSASLGYVTITESGRAMLEMFANAAAHEASPGGTKDAG